MIGSIPRRIIKSTISKPVHPGTDRPRKWTAFENLVLHIHPKKVPLETLRLTLTWGLGGMSMVLILLLASSGLLLLFVYEPFPDRAYRSILTLQNDVMFGQLVRNIHHWSANFLIVISFSHLLRVFFTGAFHTVRQFNWIIGLLLFSCILFSNFTGYLLPWDQLAYWAVTICTSMADYIPGGDWFLQILVPGSEVGPRTLLIFYILHTTLLPICLMAILPFHFWKIRKAGGVIFPGSNGKTDNNSPALTPTIPDLLLRETVVALILIAFVLMMSTTFNAPLGNIANPGLSPNPAKAPWYFLGAQELLLHFHPLFAVFVIPVSLFTLLICLPYLKYDSPSYGRWFHSRKGKQTGIVSTGTALIVCPVLIVLDEFFIDFTALMPELPTVIASGFIPTTLMLIGLLCFYLSVKKLFSTSNNETIQALFIFLLVSFFVFTITGIWFRGEEMTLTLGNIW